MAMAAPAAPVDRALSLVEPPSDTAAASPALAGLPPEADLSPAAVRRLKAELPDYLIQIALKALGYYQGALDGKFGPGSRRSAADFQAAIGTDPTGVLQPSELVVLISRAAKSGNSDSQNTFGGMFETGAGVIQDPVAAAKWYRLAADNGNTYAQTNLERLQPRK